MRCDTPERGETSIFLHVIGARTQQPHLTGGLGLGGTRETCDLRAHVAGLTTNPVRRIRSNSIGFFPATRLPHARLEFLHSGPPHHQPQIAKAAIPKPHRYPKTQQTLLLQTKEMASKYNHGVSVIVSVNDLRRSFRLSRRSRLS